jgi:hypothetical protein
MHHMKIKNTANGEIRRIALAEVTLEGLHKHASEAFHAALEKLSFTDADGDVVTITTVEDILFAHANAVGKELLLHAVFSAAAAPSAGCVSPPPPPCFPALRRK